MSYEVPVSLRSLNGELAYQYDKAVGRTRELCDEPSLYEWHFWRLVKNGYPYDARFKPSECKMLLPKRIFPNWWNMRPWEMVEFLVILYKKRDYKGQCVLNFGATRSKPNHFHVLFNEFYNSRKDFK